MPEMVQAATTDLALSHLGQFSFVRGSRREKVGRGLHRGWEEYNGRNMCGRELYGGGRNM